MHGALHKGAQRRYSGELIWRPRPLTDVYVDFLHPRVHDGVFAAAARRRRALVVGRLAARGGRRRRRRRRRRRAGCHRVAAVTLLRDGGALEPGRRYDVTPRGHHYRGGLPAALARRVRRFGSLPLLLLLVLVMVVVVVVVVERVRLEGSGLLPLGAVIVRRVAGQIVAV